MEELECGDAEIILNYLDVACENQVFTFKQNNHNIGACSNAAGVIIFMESLHLEWEHVNEGHIHIKFPSHKKELELWDAFNDFPIDMDTLEVINSDHKLLKNDNLKNRWF